MHMHSSKSQGPKINSSKLRNIKINNREEQRNKRNYFLKNTVCLNSLNTCFFEIILQFVAGKEPHAFFSSIKGKQGFAL